MATIEFTDEIDDPFAETHAKGDEKSAALVALPDRWTGDLHVDIVPTEEGRVILLARILRGDADIVIGSQLTLDEVDEFAVALREAGDVLREYSE
jgi:hypothetical protein